MVFAFLVFGSFISRCLHNIVILLPPANEVWGKVMFFIPMCHSVHRWGRGWLPSMHNRSHDQGVCIRGVCLQVGLHSRESVSRGFCIWGGGGSVSRGVCLQESRLHPGESASKESASRGVCLQRRAYIQGGWVDPSPRYMGYCRIWSTSGQYTSYWNAFLFFRLYYIIAQPVLG